MQNPNISILTKDHQIQIIQLDGVIQKDSINLLPSVVETLDKIFKRHCNLSLYEQVDLSSFIAMCRASIFIKERAGSLDFMHVNFRDHLMDLIAELRKISQNLAKNYAVSEAFYKDFMVLTTLSGRLLTTDDYSYLQNYNTSEIAKQFTFKGKVF